MKITEKQKVIFRLWFYQRTDVFVLHQSPSRSKWTPTGSDFIAGVCYFVDKKTAHSLCRKKLAEYIDISIHHILCLEEWFGIKLTEKGKRLAEKLHKEGDLL